MANPDDIDGVEAPAAIRRLARIQVRHPFAVLAAVAAPTFVALWLTLDLEVLTGFEHLLPDDRPSVQELHRVASRTAGISTFFVVLQGGESTPTDALRVASDTLVTEIAKVGPPWVGSVENGIQEARRFLMPRAGMFAELPALEKVFRELTERHEYEVAKELDSLIDDDAVPPEVNRERIEMDLGITEEARSRYPDGYYESADGRTVVVAIRSKIMSNDLTQGTDTIRRIREVVDRVDPARFHPDIRVGYSGDLQTGVSEYRDITRDLTSVGLLGAIMLICVVFLYYLRFRAVLSMLLNIGIGVLWSFGLTRLAVGHLNVATGFLFTIVAGNGINFSIIFMARFLEERRAGRSLEHGIVVAMRDTWLPTLAAAAAAGAAYGSLLVSEFRGFRDFGFIGGIGMLLCWLATYLALPSILATVERVAPFRSAGDPGRRNAWEHFRDRLDAGVAYGHPFAWAVERAPRLLFATGTVLALAGFAGLVLYVRSDPMEYDLLKLRMDPSQRIEEIRLTKLAEDVTGYVGSDGMAILVDRPDQVEPLRTALYAVRDAAPADEKPFDKVHALQDFVPADQPAKIEVLKKIDRLLRKFHDRGGISDEDWKLVKDFLPEGVDLAPFGMADLPEAMARPFTETDGTRGRIVYISPTDPEAINDARYLFRWADSYRETTLPDGSRIVGSGRAVIYADIWAAVLADIPPSIIVSFFATLLVVLFAFRGRLASFAVMGTLLLGVGWMAGLLVLLGVRLNFLNFIALPLTFGIGVDYAVNIVQRYVQEGAGGVLVAVRRTGGAVILCSLTTMLGYIALAGSMNQAVRSLGVAAVLGEVACLVAAVLVLPAGLLLWGRKSSVSG